MAELIEDGSSYNPTRRYKRTRIDMPAVVQNGTRSHFERASEVSEGGMLLFTQKELMTGSIIEVQFMLPNRSFITAFGEVIYGWADKGKFYTGVRFTEITPELQNLIRLYVDTCKLTT